MATVRAGRVAAPRIGPATVGNVRPADGLWLEITDNAAIGDNQWVYTADLYDSPWATEAIENDVVAHNTYEVGATDTAAAGYPLTPTTGECQTIKEIKPIPTGPVRYEVKGYHDIGDDEWVWAFSSRNDPKFGDE